MSMSVLMSERELLLVMKMFAKVVREFTIQNERWSEEEIIV